MAGVCLHDQPDGSAQALCSNIHMFSLSLQVLVAEDGFVLQSQPPGTIMAHHCVQFVTMALLSGVAPRATIPVLLALLACSAELAHIHIRCGTAAIYCHYDVES